jgi:hypothetical protein
MEVGRKGQRPFLRVEVCISIARDLHQVGNLTKRANRLCYTAINFFVDRVRTSICPPRAPGFLAGLRMYRWAINHSAIL